MNASLIGYGRDFLNSIDQLVGSAFNDTLTGSSAPEVLDGRGGDDLINGMAGADHLIGSGGNDTVSYVLSKAVTVDLATGVDSNRATLSTIENVLGSFNNDKITGDGAANVLNGNSGADVLAGGGAADTLIGGDGNDRFVYTSVGDSSAKGGFDLITDLQATETIDLSAIDADKKTSGDQAFRIVDHFDKHAAELVLSYDATTNETRVSLDVNGDGKADMVIRLSGEELGYSHFAL